MRKVRSAPQLAGLEAKSAIASSAAAGSPRHIHAGPTAAGKQGFQVKGSVKAGSLQAAAMRARGSQNSSSSKHRLNALMIDPPPTPPASDINQTILSEVIEQADEMIEEFVWARGLIPAGECFEQFGWTESAPPLKDVRQPQTDEQRRALASCLATPFMYDDEHLSKHIQDRVSSRSQENNRNLTSRYIEEVRDQQLEEDEKDASSFAGQQATAKVRRRRRSNQTMYKDKIQATAPPLTGRSASPNTQRFLSRTFSGLTDDSNKLHFDESSLAEKKIVANVSSSIDPTNMIMDLPDAALFSMDVPSSSTDDPKLAPGGVLEVSRNENVLFADQQTSFKKTHDNDDLALLRQAVVGGIGNENSDGATNDGIKDGKGMSRDSLVKSAADKAGDETKVLQDESRTGTQGRPKNNVVPFKRQKAPRF